MPVSKAVHVVSSTFANGQTDLSARQWHIVRKCRRTCGKAIS